MDTKKVTTIEEIKQMQMGELVELPPFIGSNKPFIVRLKKPSLMQLAANGKIPNTLLSSANSLFDKDSSKMKENIFSNPKQLSDMMGVLKILVEASMVEPTYKQLQDNGIKLQDDQMMAIFNYTQSEVKSITPSP